MAEGGKDLNTKEWEVFLGPLKTRFAPVEIVNNEKNLSREDLRSQNPFLFNFIENLKSQELVHNGEIEDKKLQLAMEIPNDETFDTLLKAFKEYIQIGSQKPDIKKSGSTWTLNMLAKYFYLHRGDFYTWEQMVIHIDDWEPQLNTNQEACKEMLDLLLSLGVTTRDEFRRLPVLTGLHRLNFHRIPECSVRTILDSILQSICRQARDELDFAIQLIHEFPIKRDCLPTNILDYGLLVPNGLLVGIVEAKTPRTMNQNAVAQFVIQLMSLLTTTEDPESSHFGILTDGYRFLFAYANKDGVYFESKGHDDGDPTVLVHEAETWKDLHYIKIKILNLCRRMHEFRFNPKNVPTLSESKCLMFTKAISFLSNQSQEPQGQFNYTTFPFNMQGLYNAGPNPFIAQATYLGNPQNPSFSPYFTYGHMAINSPFHGY